MQHKDIELRLIHQNEGQIEGLPTNPRQWTRKELNDLKKSIQETPELLQARGIIVYPHNEEYIVLGGNMRLTALQELKYKTAPCIIVEPDTPIDKLKEIVIKDNGAFGGWDFDALANEWDDLPLTDWGVPAWNNPFALEMPETPPLLESKGLHIDVDLTKDNGNGEDIRAAIELTLMDFGGGKVKLRK